MTDEPKVTLETTLSQAAVAVAALDLYARLATGQVEELVALVRSGIIPRYEPQSLMPRATADVDHIETVEDAMRRVKHALGFPSNGNLGIHHVHVDQGAKRAWEMRKALAKALAVHADPNPVARGADYDGNFVRCTDDPEPIARVSPAVLGPQHAASSAT